MGLLWFVIIGGLIGGFVFAVLGIRGYGLIGSLATATIGAIILLWLVRFVKS